MLILGWAGLTKAGYIPNFMNIEILYPESVNFWYQDEYGDYAPLLPMRPIIYLYPQEKQDIDVKLDFNGVLTASYPKYDQSVQG